MTWISPTKVMVIGGSPDGSPAGSDKTFVFDSEVETWSLGPKLQMNRVYHRYPSFKLRNLQQALEKAPIY